MADDRTNEYQKGFEQGQKSPRGIVQSIMEGIGEAVPLPSSEEYRSWKKGRDAGEKWRSEHPYTEKEKETVSAYGGDVGGGGIDGRGGGGDRSPIGAPSPSQTSTSSSAYSKGRATVANPIIYIVITIYIGLIVSYYLTFLLHPEPEKFLGGLLNGIINCLWSPTGDSVLNFFIDAAILIVGIPISVALAAGILGTGIVLFALWGVGWLLWKLGGLSVFGFIMAVGIALGLVYLLIKLISSR